MRRCGKSRSGDPMNEKIKEGIRKWTVEIAGRDRRVQN